jgi:hypothetical protein
MFLPFRYRYITRPSVRPTNEAYASFDADATILARVCGDWAWGDAPQMAMSARLDPWSLVTPVAMYHSEYPEALTTADVIAERFTKIGLPTCSRVEHRCTLAEAMDWAGDFIRIMPPNAATPVRQPLAAAINAYFENRPLQFTGSGSTEQMAVDLYLAIVARRSHGSGRHWALRLAAQVAYRRARRVGDENRHALKLQAAETKAELMAAERRLDLETSFADELEELVPDLAEATAAALQEILQLGLMMHFQEITALG